MYAAFVKLLNMSAASAFLIGVVILLRLVFRRLPKKDICVLWLLVAVRLACPFTISSSLSVFNHVGTEHDGKLEYVQYNEKTEKPLAEISLNIVRQQENESGMMLHRPNVYLPTAMGLWGAGVATMLLYALVSYLRVRRQTRERIRWKENIYLCDYVPSPFVFGLFRPRIFLPSDITETQIYCVIAHERTHIARGDHWWKALGFLLLSLHWFNPMVWIAYALLCRDMELACDERVIRNMNAAQKQTYSQVLLSCSMPKGFHPVGPLAFGEAGVKQRIKGILQYKKPTFWAAIAAVVIGLAVAALFLTDPVHSGDYLQIKRFENKWNKPKTVDMNIRIGETVQRATIYTELWENGTCTQRIPLDIPVTTEKIHLEMTRQMEGDAVAAYQVQINAEPNTASLNTTVSMPENSYQLDCLNWYGATDIQVTPEKDVLLQAMAFDHGDGGFFLFEFDNENYRECAYRLQNQECELVVWISFGEAVTETALSAS